MNEKIKVKGLRSIDYDNGLIDKFEIENCERLINAFISLFSDLGFKEDVLKELNIHYPSTKGYIFKYNSKYKAHFFIEKDYVTLVIDSKVEKKILIEKFKKYFKFFSD